MEIIPVYSQTVRNMQIKYIENSLLFNDSEGYDSNHSALTLRRLMSYIYMEHPFLMFLDHTQRRSTVGRTPLDE